MIIRSCTLLLCALAYMGEASLAQTPTYEWRGSAGSFYGSAVAFIGDVNSNGVDDVAIGAPFGAGPNGLAGFVEVRDVHDGIIMTIYGESFGDQFGASVAGLGDLDGDQVPDFVVGAWRNGQGGLQGGRAYVVSGASGAFIYVWTGAIGERLGFSVANAGDTNQDGIDDVVVGAPSSPSTIGSAHLYDGASGSLRFSWSGAQAGLQPGAQFGFSVAGGGLLNGDARNDILIGAPYATVGGVPDSGHVFARNGWTGSQILQVAGPPSGSLFGFSVAGPGHVGGDPRDDILIGSPNADAPAMPSVGRASIHVPGSFSVPLSEWWGTESQQAFGRIVAPLGDRDGDGVQEFATGSPRRSTVAGNGVGEVTIYSGATFQPLSTLSGIMASEEFGSAAAGQGDINRDGVPDLVIGAPRHSNGSGLFVGRVAVFSTPGFGSYGSGLGSLNSMSFSAAGSVAPGGVLMLGATGGPPNSLAYLGYATIPEHLVVPHPAGTIGVLLDVVQITMGQFFPFNTNVFGDLSLGISAPATGFLNGITLFTQFVAFDQASGIPAFSDGVSMTFGL